MLGGRRCWATGARRAEVLGDGENGGGLEEMGSGKSGRCLATGGVGREEVGGGSGGWWEGEGRGRRCWAA